MTLFQITGSSSFAARAALECAGAGYEVVDVHPRRRDEAPGFADANPLMRVPAIRDGEVRLSGTGAILRWIGDRFEGARKSIEARGRENIGRAGDHLDQWLSGHEWLAGDLPGVSDIYAYMLVGRANHYDDITPGGPAVASRYERVGALPGVMRARELDDLDERLIRFHPGMRGGKPLD